MEDARASNPKEARAHTTWRYAISYEPELGQVTKFPHISPTLPANAPHFFRWVFVWVGGGWGGVLYLGS